MVLPKEKQEQIFLAAAREFAAKGYDKASTNAIVKEAGIGKGMLFYYFGSKLELYNDLLKQLWAQMETLIHEMEIPKGMGIIETFQHLTRIKMKSVIEKPVWFDLVTRLYLHPEDLAVSPEAQQTFAQSAKIREARMQETFSKADMSRLRKDIPQERIMQHISFVMEGFSQHVTNTIKQTGTDYYDSKDNPFWDEYELFTEDLKTMLYEKE